MYQYLVKPLNILNYLVNIHAYKCIHCQELYNINKQHAHFLLNILCINISQLVQVIITSKLDNK